MPVNTMFGVAASALPIAEQVRKAASSARNTGNTNTGNARVATPAANQSTTGNQSTMQRHNDIPVDILPDDSFARLYKPGQRTLGAKKASEDTRQFDLSLQEEKRARSVAEALAQKQFDADETYRWAALAKSGSGGGGSMPKMSKTELKAQYKEWLASLNDQYENTDSQGRVMWQKHNDPMSVALGAIENETDWLKEMGLGTADIEELKNYASKNLKTAADQGFDLRAVKEPGKYDSLGIPGL